MFIDNYITGLKFRVFFIMMCASCILFAQDKVKSTISYKTITGLSNKVIYIERIDSTDYFLLGDQKGRLVYWNAKNNEILASANCQSEIVYNYHYDRFLNLCFISGESGVEIIDLHDLFTKQSLNYWKFFPLEGVSFVTTNPIDHVTWISTFDGKIFSFFADLTGVNEPEFVMDAQSFTKEIHVYGDVLFAFSPWNQSVYDLTNQTLLKKLDNNYGDDARLVCNNLRCRILGDRGLEDFSLEAIDALNQKKKIQVLYPYSFFLQNSSDTSWVGTRDGKVFSFDANSNQISTHEIDSTVAISAISGWGNHFVAGDHEGRIYSNWNSGDKPSIALNPASESTLDRAYLINENKMVTLHFNAYGSYVRLWDLKKAEMTDFLSFTSFQISSLYWNKAGDTLYTVHANQEINRISWQDGLAKVENVKSGLVDFVQGAFIALPNEEKLIKRREAIEEWKRALKYNTVFRMTFGSLNDVFEFAHAATGDGKSLPPIPVLETHLAEAGLGKMIEEFDILDRDIFFMKMKRCNNADEFILAVERYNQDPVALRKFYQLVNASGFTFRILKDENVVFELELNEVPEYIEYDKYPNEILFFYHDKILRYNLKTDYLQSFTFLSDPSISFFNSNDKFILVAGTNSSMLELYNLENEQNTIWTFYGLMDYLISNEDGFYKSRGEPKSVLCYFNERKISFYQSDLYYNRPHEVIKSLNPDDTLAIQLFESAYQKRMKRIGNANKVEPDQLPEISSIDLEQMDFKQKNETIKIPLQQDLGFTISRVHLLANGVPVYGKNGLKGNLIKDESLTLQLQPGENKIEIYVTDELGQESNRLLKTVYLDRPETFVKTHFIGIGIDKFNEPGHDLSYSVKDVRDLSKALKEKLGDQLTIDTLFNQNVSVSNVQALKKKLLQTNINDKVIISYSGHGLLNEEYDYFLSAYNVDFHHPEKGGIPYEVLEDLLDSIPARKKLLLIDACHSGEVDKEDFRQMNEIAGAKGIVTPKGGETENTSEGPAVGLQNSFQLMQELFVNVQRGSGATIISAAAGDQFALEGGKLENGFFTYAILQYMKDHPDVSINALKKYVYTEVEKLSGGMQKPTSRIENLEMDWRVW